MTKIVTIVGARPQFVKAAVVSRALKKYDIEEVIVHTGQHFDANMSEIFFSEMMIPKAAYNLEISGLSHGAMTGRMLEEIEKVLVVEKPTHLMVYGDTNSTLAGALAAKKMNISLIHVEAGLRSFNMKMPEEINRILTDRISDILFCPTDTAVENLEKEGFRNFNNTIIKNGDVMQDAAIFYSSMSAEKSGIISSLNLTPDQYNLVTIHRQENTDDEDNLINIFAALDAIHTQKRVVIPLHPRTKQLLKKYQIETQIEVIDPIGYFDMLELLKHCHLVMTDSGGLQKEAFFFKKHCVTIREETEWIELVKNGFNVLGGADTNRILQCYQLMSSKISDFDVNLYGNGKAAETLAHVLKELK